MSLFSSKQIIFIRLLTTKVQRLLNDSILENFFSNQNHWSSLRETASEELTAQCTLPIVVDNKL